MKIKKFRKLIVNTSMTLEKYKGLRVGQALVNELFELTGNNLCPGMPNSLDPFYNEINVNAFLMFIMLGFKERDEVEANLLYKGFVKKHLPTIYQGELTK
tara:strand:- start:106 stop:405 length:300 start_codon:yes stop_codon:yes gene_type:complete